MERNEGGAKDTPLKKTGKFVGLARRRRIFSMTWTNPTKAQAGKISSASKERGIVDWKIGDRAINHTLEKTLETTQRSHCTHD